MDSVSFDLVEEPSREKLKCDLPLASATVSFRENEIKLVEGSVPGRVSENEGPMFEVDLAPKAREELGDVHWNIDGWKCEIRFSLEGHSNIERRLTAYSNPDRDPRVGWFRGSRGLGLEELPRGS